MKENQENILSTRFKHHAWFKKTILTKKQALEYFAAHYPDFHLSKRISRECTDKPLNVLDYDSVLMGDEDRRSYQLQPEEKQYFMERCGFWKNFYKNHDYNERTNVPEYADFMTAFNAGTARRER